MIGERLPELHKRAHLSAIAPYNWPIAITKRGEPVVEITPAKTRSSKLMTRKQAIAALKKLRAEVPTLNQEQIRALIDEGRH